MSFVQPTLKDLQTIPGIILRPVINIWAWAIDSRTLDVSNLVRTVTVTRGAYMMTLGKPVLHEGDPNFQKWIICIYGDQLIGNSWETSFFEVVQLASLMKEHAR